MNTGISPLAIGVLDVELREIAVRVPRRPAVSSVHAAGEVLIAEEERAPWPEVRPRRRANRRQPISTRAGHPGGSGGSCADAVVGDSRSPLAVKNSPALRSPTERSKSKAEELKAGIYRIRAAGVPGARTWAITLRRADTNPSVTIRVLRAPLGACTLVRVAPRLTSAKRTRRTNLADRCEGEDVAAADDDDNDDDE